METKKVFLPFNPDDLRGSTELLLSEMGVHFKGLIKVSQIFDSENGGLFFVIKNKDKKVEVHVTTIRGKINVFMILYKGDKYVKDSPEINTPEGLSDYYSKTLEVFLKN